MDRESVETWYKVRILETLSEPVRQPGAENLTDSVLSVDQAPVALLPLASDEILVRRGGGSIVIEGVGITEIEADFPDLVLNQPYLLFLMANSTKQVTHVPYGGPGVFGVTGQRNLAAIVARGNGLADELRNTTGNDVSRLRDRILSFL